MGDSNLEVAISSVEAEDEVVEEEMIEMVVTEEETIEVLVVVKKEVTVIVMVETEEVVEEDIKNDTKMITNLFKQTTTKNTVPFSKFHILNSEFMFDNDSQHTFFRVLFFIPIK